MQELHQKYDIKYDSEKPLDADGHLADRVFQAGVDFFLDIGTYCITTRRVIKVTAQELQAEITSCPDELELGQGEDRVRVLHRNVEGDQEPIVIAGIQTIPFSDEEMMFKITQGCAMDRCVDGIWGGVLLRIDVKYNVVAGTPSEIYQYRRTDGILLTLLPDLKMEQDMFSAAIVYEEYGSFKLSGSFAIVGGFCEALREPSLRGLLNKVPV